MMDKERLHYFNHLSLKLIELTKKSIEMICEHIYNVPKALELEEKIKKLKKKIDEI
jgi:hypothetical protein